MFDVIFVKRPRMLPVQFVTLYKTCKPKPKPNNIMWNCLVCNNFVSLCISLGFIFTQQAVLVSEDLVPFQYEEDQVQLIWPKFINMETFKKNQAPALLDTVAENFYGASYQYFHLLPHLIFASTLAGFQYQDRTCRFKSFHYKDQMVFRSSCIYNCNCLTVKTL